MMALQRQEAGRSLSVEFNIQLNANQSWDTAGISLSGLQSKKFLNAVFYKCSRILLMALTGIKHWYYTDAEYRVNGNSGKWIQAFAEMNSRIWRKSELRERLIMMNWWQEMELSCFKSVPISMILRLRWVIPSKWTIKPNPAKFAQRTYTVMGIVNEYSYSGFSKCFALPEQFMNEATGIDCTGTISVINDMEKFDTVESCIKSTE